MLNLGAASVYRCSQYELESSWCAAPKRLILLSSIHSVCFLLEDYPMCGVAVFGQCAVLITISDLSYLKIIG